MVFVDEFYIRVMYLVAAVGVLFLLRKPLRYPDRPGSKWLALTVGAVSVWLGAVGLYYFVHGLAGSLVLYNVVLFSITVCFVGWVLIAVEFATGRSPPRPVVLALGTFAALHFVLLWANFGWMHELVYQSTTFVDEGGGINVDRGPLFWVHIVVIYVLVFLSTVLFVAEWTNSSGLRRRQAGILAITPLFGVGASFLWFAEVLPLPFDPTPIGVTVGVALLSWALYRTEFLEIAPVARRTVVEEMPDAVITLDDRNRVVDWNRAASDLFGVEEPAVGMAAEAFFEPVPPETLAEFEGVSRTDTQVSFELDGRDRHFSVSISPIETDHAESIGRVVVVRDITAIKRREKQLLEQNEYLDEFASIVSHDLQGPLMEIRGSADLAVRTRDVSHVDSVLDAADRMDQLVTDLLELARTGRQIEETEPIDLADIAETAWARVWSTNAELVVETDRSVSADGDRVQQALENLFRNAVEHGSTSPDSRARQDAGRASSSEPSVADAPENAVEHSSTSPRSSSTHEDAVEHGSTSSRSAKRPDDSVEHGRTDRRAVDAVTQERAGEDGAGGAGSPDAPGDATGGEPVSDDDSPEDVRITVGSLPDGFYVEDDGRGISPADRERVFERGYTTTAEGTGLGLGIVRQIAGAHGWSVRVTEGDAGGARFEFTGVDVRD